VLSRVSRCMSLFHRLSAPKSITIIWSHPHFIRDDATQIQLMKRIGNKSKLSDCHVGMSDDTGLVPETTAGACEDITNAAGFLQPNQTQPVPSSSSTNAACYVQYSTLCAKDIGATNPESQTLRGINWSFLKEENIETQYQQDHVKDFTKPVPSLSSINAEGCVQYSTICAKDNGATNPEPQTSRGINWSFLREENIETQYQHDDVNDFSSRVLTYNLMNAHSRRATLNCSDNPNLVPFSHSEMREFTNNSPSNTGPDASDYLELLEPITQEGEFPSAGSNDGPHSYNLGVECAFDDDAKMPAQSNPVLGTNSIKSSPDYWAKSIEPLRLSPGTFTFDKFFDL
jgi:hypothetical protein